MICGLATCINCIDKDDEERCLCKLHKKGNNERHELIDVDDTLFEPNYVDVYLSCLSIPGFDFNELNFPGFELLEIRAEETMQKMGNNMVKTVLKEKEKLWKIDLELLTKRRLNKNKVYHGRKRKMPLPVNITEGCDLVTCKRTKKNLKQECSFKRGARRKCCFAGCMITDGDKDFVTMKLVKSKPKRSFVEMNASGEKVDSIKRVMRNHYLRYYTLDRRGIKDEEKDYFLCDQHELETKTVKKTIKRSKRDLKVTLNLTVPKPVGVQRQSTTASKGTARDRLFSSHVDLLQKEITSLDKTKSKKYETIITAAVENARLAMQAWDKLEESVATLPKNTENGSCLSESKGEPKLKYNTLTNKEVKRRTGFISKEAMLAFIVLVCNADRGKMTETKMSLTWMEEWFVYFEYLWGRTLTRWLDVEASTGLNTRLARIVFDYRNRQVLACRA
jgi:hypothetical protein